MRKTALAIAIACGLALSSRAMAAGGIVVRYNFGRQYTPRNTQPAPDTGFYRQFAAGAVGVQSAMMHGRQSPLIDPVWQQAQAIDPALIVNPYCPLSAETLRVVNSPFRNFRIDRAGDAPRVLILSDSGN